MELKKATTFEEQIKLLEQKDIKIANIDACKDFLSRTNYYRLSGYYLPFIKKDEEKCFISIDFDRIQNIYAFDADFFPVEPTDDIYVEETLNSGFKARFRF